MKKFLYSLSLVIVIGTGLFFIIPTPNANAAVVQTVELPRTALWRDAINNTTKEGGVFTAGFSLDMLAYMLAEIALEVITADIVAWINSGFQGSPAFVQNPSSFLESVADLAAGEFLEDIGAGFLCEPFSLDLQFAIEIGYFQAPELASKYTCRLTDSIDNVEAFLENDLSRGGLEQFFEVTAVPQNNPYVATIDIRRELDIRTTNARIQESRLLDWGGGFLSFRECREGETQPHCKGDVLTPGDVIQSQLNETLTIGERRLVVADEINEIVGALLTQVVRKALGGARGLTGVSTSIENNSNVTRTNDPRLSENLEGLEEQIAASISAANQIRDIFSTQINRIDGVLQTIQSSTCSDPRLSDIGTELQSTRTTSEERQVEATNAIPPLERLLEDVRLATTRSEFIDIAQRFQALFPIPTEAGVVEAQALLDETEALIEEAAEIIVSC